MRRNLGFRLHLSLALSVATLGALRTTRAQAEPRAIDLHVAKAAERVLVSARRAHLNVPFESAAVGRSGGPKSWVISLDAKRPSPFEGQACTPKPDGEELICEVHGRRVLCSENAVAHLIKMTDGVSAAACGGDFDGDPRRLPRQLDKAPFALDFVLAHELAHIVLKHEVASSALLPGVRGSPKQRMRDLRSSILSAASQAQIERAADAWATKVMEATLQRLIEKNGLEHAAYVATAVGTDLRLAFMCVDEVTRCRWDADLQLPASEQYLESVSSELVCRALQAEEGAPFPVFRGSHGDWGIRLAAVSALTTHWRKTYPPAQSTPFGELASFIGAVNDIFVFWGNSSEKYFSDLSGAVKRASATATAKTCAP